jgi:Zn-dependent protease with chaperone function
MSSKEYRGTVFSKEIETGRSGVMLKATDMGVDARTPDGRIFHIPYSQLKLGRKESSGKMFLLSPQDGSFNLLSLQKGLLKEIRKKAPLEVIEQADHITRTNRNNFLRLSAITAGVLLILVIIINLIQVGFNAAIMLLPKELDEQLGEIGLLQMRGELRDLRDPLITETMETILSELEMHVETGDDYRWPFRVMVVRSEEVNAFALPGGTIVFFSGLLESAESPEEIAGVMAHEMGHIINRHGIKRIAQSIGTITIIRLFFGDAEGLFEMAAELLTIASINNYSQDQEREADETSVKLMYSAGLNPEAFTDFFYRLKEEHGDIPSYLSWLSTHPSHSERIKAIEDMIKNLPEKEERELDIDWDKVKSRL